MCETVDGCDWIVSGLLTSCSHSEFNPVFGCSFVASTRLATIVSLLGDVACVIEGDCFISIAFAGCIQPSIWPLFSQVGALAKVKYGKE